MKVETPVAMELLLNDSDDALPIREAFKRSLVDGRSVTLTGTFRVISMGDRADVAWEGRIVVTSVELRCDTIESVH